MAKLKDLTHKEDTLGSGHRLCPGCGASIIVNQLGRMSEAPMVVGCATGCLEVATTIYPYTAWNVPFIHSAFENSAATVSGMEAAYEALKSKGKIPADDKRNFVAFGGDGGTYDIGFQSLSGAMERGHNMTYVCYDNGAYMNTGMQRSSATPYGAATSTTPIGTHATAGKEEYRKDLTAVMAAHNIPYVAQASLSHWKDLMRKAEKAFTTPGPAFLNILSPCPRGWRTEPGDSIELSRLAVSSCYWPIFEVDHGEWKVNHRPKNKIPAIEFLKPQGRFKHLFSKGNEEVLAHVQERIDHDWDQLLWKADCSIDAAAE